MDRIEADRFLTKIHIVSGVDGTILFGERLVGSVGHGIADLQPSTHALLVVRHLRKTGEPRS
jgi:hypothetical protein